MRLSEFIDQVPELGKAQFVEERDFDYFARNPSQCKGRICVYASQKRYCRTIPNNTTMVITTADLASRFGNDAPYGLCIVDDPKVAFFRAFIAWVDRIKDAGNLTEIGSSCSIADSAKIAKRGVRIGNDVVIEAGVIICENVTIGNGCTIRSGAKIGMQDFNYFTVDGERTRLPHAGGVVIGNDVEVGLGSFIGAALYPQNATTVGDRCIIGMNCAIGHDDFIEKEVMIYSNSILGGFVNVGEGSSVYLSATVKNGISIGRNARVGMGSCVLRDIPDHTTVFGNPARAIQ